VLFTVQLGNVVRAPRLHIVVGGTPDSGYRQALNLKPRKFYNIKVGDDEGYVGELRGCFNDVLVKMVVDEDLREKIDAQLFFMRTKESEREIGSKPFPK
jgi:hypothetical protein